MKLGQHPQLLLCPARASLPSTHCTPAPRPPSPRHVSQVLVTLQRLVHALGAESPATYPLVLPVLRLCTDPSQPDELNLLEDGLQLWLVALRHAPAPHPGLLGEPFPNLVAAMTKSTEHIAVSCLLCASRKCTPAAVCTTRAGHLTLCLPALLALLAGHAVWPGLINLDQRSAHSR